MTSNIQKHRILILDFGSQYTQLIARRIREIGVYCELYPHDLSDSDIKAFQPCGVILSGGPRSILAEGAPRVSEIVFQLGCPVLGICYGMQAMAQQLGGQVANTEKSEYGYARLCVLHAAGLLADVEDHVSEDGRAYLDVWMSHGDSVTVLPPGFEAIACTDSVPYAAIAQLDRQFYGLQFHPEVTHTRQGRRLLEAFLFKSCACEADWTAPHIVQDRVAGLRRQIGSDRVLTALSGGVDSAVLAALLHKAVGQQLICVFVDTGLLRLYEADEVMRVFSKHLGVQVIRVNAQQRFLKALEGVIDPEEKRKTIGQLFIEIFEETAESLEGIPWLGQGTIYPDVIESAKTTSQAAHLIKSHHNVGGLPEAMSLKLIEPLRDLFKDEVRTLGLALGLPSEWVNRHPFPGPGLALRILGEVRQSFLDIVRQADAIFIEELKQKGYYEQVSQAFAVFLPVKSVGIKGDARCYEPVIALRSVTTEDFMTVHWSELPHAFLGEVSQRIVNEIPSISRVVYDISGKPPATVEWE